MALRRRSFYSGASNEPGGTSSVGFDPAAAMPAERPGTPFSPAPTPGPRGGGVGGSVDPTTGVQSGAATPGSAAPMGGGPGAPGGGAPPIMPGESSMPTPRAFYAPPLAPSTAAAYTGAPTPAP